MRALLRKDAVWLIAFAVVGVAVRLAALIGKGNEEVWIDPGDRYTWASYSTLAVSAALLGIFSVLHEDVRRTRAYLLHRPISFRTFWVARQLGCAAVLLSWLLVPLGLHFLAWWMFSANRVLLDGRLFALHWQSDLLALPAYAAGCFAASLSRRVWVLILLGSALVIAVPSLFAVGIISLYGKEDVSSWFFLPLGVLAFPVLLAGSYLGERRLDDADHPWPLRRLLWLALPLLVPAAICATLGLQELQYEAQKELFERYPSVVRMPDGETRLVRWRDGGWVQVDGEHQNIPGARLASAQTTVLWAPYDHRRPESEPREPRARARWHHRTQNVECGRSNKCYLDLDDHRMYITQYADDERGESDIFRLRLGKGPDGAPFSWRAEVLGSRYGQRVSLVVWEPEEHALWSYPLGSRAAHFERAELPGGDRPIEIAWEPRGDRSVGWWTAPGDRIAVRGERGFYDWSGQMFAAVTPERALALAAEQRIRDAERSSPAVVSERSVFGHTVEIPGQGGRPGLRHTFTPRTWNEQGFAVALTAPSLVRPPLLQVISALIVEDDQTHLVHPTLFDRVPAGAGMGWLLALNLALGAGLVTSCFVRLRRLGASRGHQVFWVSSVALLGLLAFLVYRLLETRRAWRPLPAPEPAPPLLIQTI